MSFLYDLTHNINPYKRKKYRSRKEKRDSLVIKNYPLIDSKRERASAFTSKGSITLEAAIVVPIFFFAILCLAYLLEMMALQMTVRNALYSAGREVAQQAYVGTILSAGELEERIIHNIGKDRLDGSVIAGGSTGIDCSKTTCNWNTRVMDLCVQYRVEIPILMFRISPINCEETLRVKGWTGYAYGAEDLSQKETVYVTETGIVYHKDPNCTYLDMSIVAVDTEQIKNLRNESGGKYYPCESCEKAEENTVNCYITRYGTRYHKSLNCKKIQRTIYAITKEEAHGLGGCSKCVK